MKHVVAASAAAMLVGKKNVAIVGGGIAGSLAASILVGRTNCTNDQEQQQQQPQRINVDLFDQGRSGVGGRTSTRRQRTDTTTGCWDHGCQFFRADTPRFKEVVEGTWIKHGICREWNARFASDDESNGTNDFFGLPSHPPFYIGSDGMQSIPKKLLEQCDSDRLNVFSGTRVSRMQHNAKTNQWTLYGTLYGISGNAAYHDTPEKVVQLLTDVSSSFGGWHRASAGVPEQFAERVRARVNARVPLFSAMVALERPLAVNFDVVSFHKSDTLWFAARMGSKVTTSSCTDAAQECWTLVSTPEYAVKQIEATPMQDPETGAFLPQDTDYLTTVPGPDLLKAFQGCIGDQVSIVDFPAVSYLGAQRWGSAMPCHGHLDKGSPTRKVLSGVPYDSGLGPLAPTTRAPSSDRDFIADESLMLFQAGDMMSFHTPGFEGAALSGMDAANHIIEILGKETQSS
jgi:predicted NAD/FAD-dependent oxidoreductase